MPNTNGHGPKRAILYARVSTDEQARSGYSLAQQLEALREYAAREGYEVLEEVTDPGQSGASLERPGMDRMRGLVAGGGVSVVLAQDRDRFAREPAYHYLLRKEFEEYGTKVRALNDRGTTHRKASSQRASSTSSQSSSGRRQPSAAAGASSARLVRARLSPSIPLTTASSTTPAAMDTRWTRRLCGWCDASSVWWAPSAAHSTP
jgi:hypothetical protein